MENWKGKIRTLVINGLSDNLILGMDFLRQYSAIIDIVGTKITLKNDRGNKITVKTKNYNNQCHKINAKRHLKKSILFNKNLTIGTTRSHNKNGIIRPILGKNPSTKLKNNDIITLNQNKNLNVKNKHEDNLNWKLFEELPSDSSCELNNKPCKIIINRDIVIKRNGTATCPIKISGNIIEGNFVIIPKKPCVNIENLTKAIHNYNHKKGTKVKLSNTERHDIKLFKGTTIAYLEQTKLCSGSVLLASVNSQPYEHSINNELNEYEYNELKNLIEKYSDIFAWTSNEIGECDIVEHAIDTGNAKPIRQKPYRVAHTERKIIQDQVQEMLDNNVVRPSQGEWASPVVLVKKKDGEWRFCVDYRKLNEVTVKDVYPMPLIEDIMSYLGDAKFFTTLDMFSGYWQCKIKEEDKQKTCFVTPDGCFEFNRLSFGLCNAPSTFQKLADTVFNDMKWNEVLIYLDDIIIFSATFEEHLSRLERVFKKLRNANLKLKPSKCNYAQTSLNILGHFVTRDGVKPDSDKIRAVENFPKPEKIKDVQSFLGLVNFYRKYIQNFSQIAKPLHELLRKNTKFIWNDRAEKAFQELKNKLISAPLLAHFRPHAETELRTDACGYGIGAVLLQKNKEGVFHPIAYASRKLTKAEMNYSITEQECLAAVWALKYFRSYIWGAHVRIVTDHHALCWLKSVKDPSGRLARWAVKLQDFDYEISHKSGSTHRDADCLSRYPVDNPTPRDEQDANSVPTYLATPEDIIQLQEQDPDICEIKNALRDRHFGNTKLQRKVKNFKVINEAIYKKNPRTSGRKDLLVIPRNLRAEILYSNHNEPLAGHLGFSRTFEKIRNRYYWDGMQNDIEKYIKGCEDCQSRKPQTSLKPAGFLNPIRTGSPFEMVGIDLLGPLHRTKSGKNTIVVATDYATRYALTRALPNAKAEHVAKFLVEEVICKHGCPKYILSDRGKVFQSDLVTELLKNMGTESTFTTAYHPQCNGLTERLNKTIADMLSLYTNTAQNDWDEYLPHVTMAYNTAKQESTQETPFKLVYGREPVLPTEAQLLQPINNDDIIKMRNRIIDIRQNATLRLHTQQDKTKERYDKKHREVSFKVGDKIKLRTPLRQVGKSDKLQPKYFGPYEVLEKISPVNYVVKNIHGKRKIVDKVHVSRMFPYFEKWSPDEVTSNPPARYNLRNRTIANSD